MTGLPGDAGPLLSARSSRLVLVALVAVAVVRGAFWAGLIELWSPIDEIAHFGYVESLATGEGIPTVGRDLVSDEVLAVTKTSPTFFDVRSDLQPPHRDATWGPVQAQYEAVHGPTYYALMVPAYWLGRPFGFLPAVYLVRLASVVAAAASVVVVWLLARELFPKRPAAWAMAAAVLAVLNGVNSNTAIVSNDALVVTSGAAAMLVFVRGMRRPTVATAVAAGAVFGFAVVTKTTALTLVPLLGLAFVATLVRHRDRTRRLLVWAPVFTIAALTVLAPWIAFNVATYGAISASEAVDEITGSLQARAPDGWDGLRTYVRGARMGFWELQLRTTAPTTYGHVIELLLLAATAGGIAVAAARARRVDALRLGWLALALPGGLAVMIAIVQGVFGGGGVPVGRHYYAVLPAVAVLVAAGLVTAIGPRWATAALLAMLALASFLEIGFVTRYVDHAYGEGILEGNLIPVVDQSWADEKVTLAAASFDPGCPARLVGVKVEPSPEALTARIDGREVTIPRSGISHVFSYYRLPAPTTEPFELVLPPSSTVAISRTDRSPALSAPGGGDPVARLFCAVREPRAKRFEAVHSIQHPGVYTRSLAIAWPRAWTLLLAVGAVVAVVLNLRGRRAPDARAQRGSGSPPEHAPPRS